MSNSSYALQAMPDPEASWEAEIGGVSLIFGAGTLVRLGEELARLGIRRPLVVTDPGILDAGLVERAMGLLSDRMELAIFSDVSENPDSDVVAKGAEVASKHRADGLLAIGGGSSLDCAKGINFIVSNGGRIEDYWGDGKAEKPMLPSIGIPTTAGTGSEAQRFALISHAETHRKMACGDRKARFKTVILDPDLLETVPRNVAAVTGIDAVSHAVESYVTRRRTPISQLFAGQAWSLLNGSLETYLERPSSRTARAGMLLGSHLAGAAIEASMLGAAHSSANPLTAQYDVIHGQAVGLMLPHVVRFNGINVNDLYADLVRGAGLNGSEAPGATRLSTRLTELMTSAGLPTRLSEFNIPESALGDLAALANQEWTAKFNPRRVVEQDFVKLYEAAF